MIDIKLDLKKKDEMKLRNLTTSSENNMSKYKNRTVLTSCQK